MTEDAPLHEALSVFREAIHWKTYWSKAIAPFIGERVLEAGAGVGANMQLFFDNQRKRVWVCMEPDTQLVKTLAQTLRENTEPKIVAATIDALSETSNFDSILYIDVLEHIEDDVGELRRASARLAPGGKLIVLSPAYNVLYSEFDKAIGHFRRYTGRTLRDLKPDGMRLVSLRYLDSVGLMLSLGNRLLLRQSQPTLRQILFWDRVIIRMSRIIDPLIAYSAGRSIIAVWERDH